MPSPRNTGTNIYIYIYIHQYPALDSVSILSWSTRKGCRSSKLIRRPEESSRTRPRLGEMGPYSLRGGRPRKSAWSCVFRTKGRWIQQKFLMCFVGKHGYLAVYDVRQFMQLHSSITCCCRISSLLISIRFHCLKKHMPAGTAPHILYYIFPP